MPSRSKEISLYFHIPFCSRKCDYCHFYVIPPKDSFKKILLEGIEIEISRNLDKFKNKILSSIYFGGGTPSLLGAQYIAKILQWINQTNLFKNPIEITLEANPENINKKVMREYFEAGINRVSIGIQTFHDATLKSLGRKHNSQQAIDAVFATADSGIENISIDLMYDLPRQTFSQWEDSLSKAVQLPISHLSLYNLTIEPHTVFFKRKASIVQSLPNENESKKMYLQACNTLKKYEFQQYEISAFAKKNSYSRHNSAYWTGQPFLGFGPSAFSYWNYRRFRNIANINRYYRFLKNGKSPIDFEEELCTKSRKKELLAIQLRLLFGLNLSLFEKQHGLLEEETKKNLSQLIKSGLIQQKGSLICLSEKGKLFYDSVATEII